MRAVCGTSVFRSTELISSRLQASHDFGLDAPASASVTVHNPQIRRNPLGSP